MTKRRQIVAIIKKTKYSRGKQLLKIKDEEGNYSMILKIIVDLGIAGNFA